MITKFTLYELQSYPDYGYRAGDLKRKAETLQNFRGGRGTGHFGTGFYFFGTEEQAKGYAKPISARYGKETDEPHRPISKENFSKYNLLKIHTFNGGLKLHDVLKEINHIGINGFKSKALNRMWDDEDSVGEPFSQINVGNLIDRRNKRAKELLDYIKCPKTNWNKSDFTTSDIRESYDLVKDYVYYHSSKSSKSMWSDIEKSIDDRILKFINYTEKDKELDGVYWKSDINKIKRFFDKYKSEVESDKVKKSKYIHEEIRKMARKLAVIISNQEYINSDFRSDHRDVDEITNIIEKVISQNLRQDPYNSKTWNDDTKSTKIMKSLGYEGIDVRGVDGLDNSTFGSIIYDIKK